MNGGVSVWRCLDVTPNVLHRYMEAIQSVINLRRRFGGPGLHALVGRVRSRGVTCDVVYRFGFECSQVQTTAAASILWIASFSLNASTPLAVCKPWPRDFTLRRSGFVWRCPSPQPLTWR